MGSYHLSYVHQLNAIELGGPQCCGSVSRAAGHVRGELPATRRCYPKLAGGFFCSLKIHPEICMIWRYGGRHILGDLHIHLKDLFLF